MNYYDLLDTISNDISTMKIPDSDGVWQAQSKWERHGDFFEFTAISTKIINLCNDIPNASIITPTMAQSVHFFHSGDQILYKSSSIDFSSAGNMNSVAVLPCFSVKDLSDIKWTVRASGQFYANINHYPTIAQSPSWPLFWVQTLPAITAGILLMICLISSIAFFRGIKNKIYFLFISTSFSLGTFFVLALPAFFPIEGSSDTIHRLHDTFLWVGLACLWFLFEEFKLAARWVPKFILFVTAIAIFVIWTAKNLSQAQVGSLVAHAGNLAVITSVCFRFIYNLFRKKLDDYELSIFACCLILALAGFNDLMQSLGIMALPLFSMGILSIVFLATIVVNRSLQTVLHEHNELRSAYARENAVADTIRMLAHDVRAPFLLLRNGIELLKLSDAAELKENMKIVEGEVNDAITKTNVLLSDVLSTSLTQKSSDLAWVKANDVVEQAMWLCGQVFPSKAKKIIVVRSSPTLLNCDQHKLARAISNIIINALEAALDEGEVEVSVERIGSQAVLKIRNTHSFICADDLSKIFEIGFSKDKKGGTGLGLNIAKKFIEESKGSIECISRKDDLYPYGLVEFKISFPTS